MLIQRCANHVMFSNTDGIQVQVEFTNMLAYEYYNDGVNPLIAKLSNLNFHPLGVVSR